MPEDPDLNNNWGVALQQLGKYSEAAARYSAALRVAPGHSDARANWAALVGSK
jgi:Flp pilus assembly protein TadD